MIENFERIDPAHIDIRQDQAEEANVLLDKTFEFYGGYAQLSANCKDQVIESKVLQQYMQKITFL